MILSDDEIMAINQTAEFDSAIGYARAIEAKVIEKLSDKLRDGDRYEWIKAHVAVAEKKRVHSDTYNVLRYEVETDLILDKKHQYALDNDIDAAIKESK